MSVFIPKAKITPEIYQSIIKQLSIKPTPDAYDKNPSAIDFYVVADGGVYIPYTYSAMLFKEHFNKSLVFPEINLVFKGNLYPQQIPVFEETMEALKSKGSAIIKVPPGYGKTVLGAKLICELKLPAVVLTHRKNLLDQWVKTFNDTIFNPRIWIIGEPEIPHDIIICMDQRVDKIPVGIRKNIGVLVIDEAHSFCAEGKVSSILGFTPKYIIAETATPERADGKHFMLNLLCGTKMISREITKEFKVFQILTNIKVPITKNFAGKVDYNKIIDFVISSQERNEIIAKIVKDNPDDKILILSSRVSHVNIIKSILDAQNEKSDTLCGSKNNYKDSRILIGTISKIGTGFDEKNACEDFGGIRINLVILATSIKDLALLEQTTGRGFRSDFPKIYDLVDENNVLKSHWKQRLSWYEAHNAEII